MDKIRRLESQGKYTFIIDRDDPAADRRGRILEHRYVAQKVLGRRLSPDEVVHHIDGDKKNNTEENLCVMNIKEHKRAHSNVRVYECPVCMRMFERAVRNARGKRVFCSRSCAGTFYRNFLPKVKLDVGGSNPLAPTIER